MPSFGGAKGALPVVNIMEVTIDMLQGRESSSSTPTSITERVTYHDPCNIARTGWIVDQPREILRAFCKNYVDMEPKGEKNYCCGGGGGTVSVDEIRRYRTRRHGQAQGRADPPHRGDVRRRPVRELQEATARGLRGPRPQDVQVVGLHDLLYKAIILGDGEGSHEHVG